MKRFGKYIYVLILIFYSAFLHAQVKITDGAVLTMDNNSLLELESTNKGLLIPRISINDINNASPLSANGGGLNGGNPLAIQPNLGKDLLKVGLTGLTSPEKIPEAIKDLALNAGKDLLASSKGYISSSIDTLSQNVADTYKNIFSGSNISSTATNAANDNVKNLYSELLWVH